jgi:ATP-dependent Clp protease protease subunit
MALKYIYNQSRDTLFLQGAIGGDVNGFAFANEILFIAESGYTPKILINSGGGSVIQAYSIVEAIQLTGAETHNVGIAASSASWILASGSKRKANDYSTVMIHNAFNPTSEKLSEKDKHALEAFNNSILSILSSKTGKDSDQLREMMNKETWFNADQSLEMGFIDEVVTTGKKIKEPVNDVSRLYSICNQLIIEDQMDKVTELLGVQNGSAEDVIFSKISDVLNENQELKSQKEEIENKLKEANEKLEKVEAEKAEAELKRVTDFVENAIKEGKLDEEQKESTVKLGLVDFEAIKNIVSAKSKQAIDITKIINNEEPKNEVEKDFEWYSKNDPAGLAKIKNEQPERFEKLANNYITKYNK